VESVHVGPLLGNLAIHGSIILKWKLKYPRYEGVDCVSVTRHTDKRRWPLEY
jgi:hypothetical protein